MDNEKRERKVRVEKARNWLRGRTDAENIENEQNVCHISFTTACGPLSTTYLRTSPTVSSNTRHIICLRAKQ
ncbi:hypothetical protein Y032_0126g1318 [Ancylostoma ceylanicum]|uniref:Uncharacterized protein n=1 Tax=Ancylostoma ceylanicum TaxID=53326 RepID=A0A016T8K5_9BILA|nr:hypothetical protein Y032_0126g1318 [Ancylostoma ceylanicum]